MEGKKIGVKNRAGETRTARLSGAEYEAGLETVKRIAVRTRGGQLVTVGLPGDYVRNARTVQGVAAAGILSGETVYGVEARAAEGINANTDKTDIAAHIMEFSSDGVLFLGFRSGMARLYRVEKTGSVQIQNLDHETAGIKVRAAAFSPDGKLLVISWEDMTKLFSIEGDMVTELGELGGDLNGYADTLAFSPDGGLLVAAGGLITATLYAVTGTTVTKAGQLPKDEYGQEMLYGACGAAFSPDGARLAVMKDGGGKLYSIEGTTVTWVRDIACGVVSPYTKVRFSPDGGLLVDTANGVRIHPIEGTAIGTATYLTYPQNPQSPISALDVRFSPDGKLMAVAGSLSGDGEGTLYPAGYLYSVNGTQVELLGVLRDREGKELTVDIESAAFSPDGTMLALGLRSGGGSTIQLVDGQDLIPDGALLLRPAANGKIPAGNYLVGFAKGAMEKGQTGQARIIGEVTA